MYVLNSPRWYNKILGHLLMVLQKKFGKNKSNTLILSDHLTLFLISSDFPYLFQVFHYQYDG